MPHSNIRLKLTSRLRSLADRAKSWSGAAGSEPDTHTSRKQRRRRTAPQDRHPDAPHHEQYEEGQEELCGFYVDVGQPEQLYVDASSTATYDCILQTPGRMIVKVTYDNGDNDIMLLRWSHDKTTIDTRGHVCASKVSKYICVPTVREKRLFKFYDTYVMVTVRSYIPGEPADQVWHAMSPDDKQTVLDELGRKVLMISLVRSEYFGHAQLGRLRTTRAHTYMYALAMLARVRNIVDVRQAMTLTDNGSSDASIPILCHGALTLDHVILSGIKISGIVGWGSADFKPPALDRVMYYFKSDPSDDMCWFRFLSDVPCAGSHTSTHLMSKCIDYAYWVSRHGVSEPDAKRIDLLMNALIVGRDGTVVGDGPSLSAQLHSTNTNSVTSRNSLDSTATTTQTTAFWNDSQTTESLWAVDPKT